MYYCLIFLIILLYNYLYHSEVHFVFKLQNTPYKRHMRLHEIIPQVINMNMHNIMHKSQHLQVGTNKQKAWKIGISIQMRHNLQVQYRR